MALATKPTKVAAAGRSRPITTTAARPATNPSRASKSNVASYTEGAEHDDEIMIDRDGEMVDVKGGSGGHGKKKQSRVATPTETPAGDDDDDDDATADLAAILQAFQKTKSKKNAAAMKALEKSFHETIQRAHEQADGAAANGREKCDQIIHSLHLDDQIDVGPGRDVFAPLFETLSAHTQDVARDLKAVIAAHDPANCSFDHTARKIPLVAIHNLNHRKTVSKRPKRAKKVHGKFKKAVRQYEAEQLEMVELNARRGPLIIKHVKALATV